MALTYRNFPTYADPAPQWPEWGEYKEGSLHYWMTQLGEHRYGVTAFGAYHVELLDEETPPEVGLYEVVPSGWRFHDPILKSEEISLSDALHAAAHIRQKLDTIMLLEVL